MINQLLTITLLAANSILTLQSRDYDNDNNK